MDKAIVTTSEGRKKDISGRSNQGVLLLSANEKNLMTVFKKFFILILVAEGLPAIGCKKQE